MPAFALMSEASRRLAVLEPHVHDGVPLTRAAAAAGVPLRTAQRWLAGYLAGGAGRAVRPVRAGVGARRFPTELVAAVEGLALRRPPPKVAEILNRYLSLGGSGGIAGFIAGRIAATWTDTPASPGQSELIFVRVAAR